MSSTEEAVNCAEAYVTAYKKAAERGLPSEDCTLVAKLAFEAQFSIEAEKFKLMNQPSIKAA
jgi:hypothetical protein